MTKLFFLFVMILVFPVPVFLRAEEPPRPEAAPVQEKWEELAKLHHVTWPYTIVTYSYKNEKGRTAIHKNFFKNLPPELQNKDWRCYIDYNGDEICMAVD